MIGGHLFKHPIVTLGATSAEAIYRIRLDSYFMGVTALHPETGVSTGDREEAAIKRLIASQAAETVALAARDKIGAASPYRIMSLAEISTLVTEAGLDDDLLRPFRTASIDIVQA